MLGRLALLAGGTALSHATPKTQKRQPAGPIGLIGIAGCVIVMMIFNIKHDLTVGLFVVMPLICSTLIAIGWVSRSRKVAKVVGLRIAELPSTPAVQTEFATVTQLRKRADQLKRMKRVEGILLRGCPVCGSMPGVSCRVTDGLMHVVLDERASLYAHPQRIADAVKHGSADIEDVTAQFGDAVPDEIWEAVL